MANNDKDIEAYKAYFDLWTKTRDERTDNNKYFLSLLFADTLVAVFTAVLGATTATAFPDLTRTLLLVMLAAAVAISAIWACKLFALNIVEGSQQSVLKAMEEHLFPFPEQEVTFYMQKLPWRKKKEKRQLTARLGMELFQNRQGSEESKPWYNHLLWWASYWALPLVFIAVFVVLFLYLLTHPSAIPLPSPAALLNVSVNATRNAAVNANLVAQ